MNIIKRLDVMPFHDDFANCFEECMISVANYFGRNYIPMYSQAWGFSFREENDQSNNVGYSLNADRGRVYDLFAAYCGIQVSFVNKEDAHEVINIIGNELENNTPIGVLMDTYYYSWDPNKNQHGQHWFLITGIDAEKEIFYCTDPYFMQKDAVLSFEDFINGYLGVHFRFSLVNDEVKVYDWKGIIDSTINKIEGKSHSLFDNMLEFADYLEKNSSLNREKAMCSRVIDMPFYINLQALSRSRKQFAKFLEHIASKYSIEELYNVSMKLNDASCKWDVIRGIMVKGIVTSNESIIKLKIPAKIREIAHYEHDIFNLMVNVSGSTSGKNTNTSDNFKQNSNQCNNLYDLTNYTYLDLSKYFNNNGFGSLLDNKSRANLNGNGLFFVTEDIPEEEIWEVAAMKFKFPKLMDGSNDNISCIDQTIDTPFVQGKKLMLLATADFGSYKEAITIHYVDGSTEEIAMGVTEYVFEPMFEEVAAWEGRACERLNDTIQILNSRVKIFAKTYELKKHGGIKQITLPYLPNIHIFAITMV